MKDFFRGYFLVFKEIFKMFTSLTVYEMGIILGGVTCGLLLMGIISLLFTIFP